MDSTHSQRNAIEELAEEFMRRRRNGEAPTIADYVQRYPERADEIRELFPTLELIENVRDDVAQAPTVRDRHAPVSHVGERLGDYRILREIGRGGMGIVYEADQESLGRRVALKVLLPELVRSSKYLDRFQREARAAANLQHTNIVPVFGVGEDQGVHYYVMQFIHGRGMDEIMAVLRNEFLANETSGTDETSAGELAVALETGRPVVSNADNDSPDDESTSSHEKRHGVGSSDSSRKTYFERIADLGAQLADALAYAHRRGVLHRDIKPSNLLIDLAGNVWITDFGLAKVEGERDLTATGDIVGTLRYIPPESLRGHFDARGDVYGLGLTLYELVARRKAFDSSDRGELVRQISQEGPPRLARREGMPRDLETIIHKAVERDPKDRYSSAESLAADLRRFLRHEPVLARRISPPARLMRWATRNRALATVSALLLVGLLVGFVASLVVSGRLLRLTDDLTTALHDSRQQNYVGDIGLAFAAIQRGDLGRARTLLGNHLPGPGDTDLRGFEWRYLWSRSQGNYTADLGRYHGFLSGVAVSPDGRFVALNRSDPWRVELVDLASGRVEHSIESSGQVVPLIFSPSGNLLIGQCRGRVVGWDSRTWEAREPLDLTFPLAFGHDTNRETFVAQDGDHLSVWNATQWKKIGDLVSTPGGGGLLVPGYGEQGHMTNVLAVSSDDRFVYLAGGNGIRRWDCTERTELAPFHLDASASRARTNWNEGLACLATSADGQLAVGDRWGNVRLIDPETGQVLHTFQSHIGWVSCLRFARDGNRLVSGGGDRNVVLYDPLNRSILDRLLGHKTQIWGLDISADGKAIASGSGNGGHVLTWSLGETDGWELERAGILNFAIMEDSRILFLRDTANDAEFYDPIAEAVEPAGAERFVDFLREHRALPLAASPHGKWVVTREGNTLVVWDVSTAERVRALSHDAGGIAEAGFTPAVFSPDSRYLVTAGKDSEVRLWRTDDWTSTVLCQQVRRTLGIGFSGNSRRVAISDQDKYIRVFDLTGGLRQILEKKEPFNLWSAALSRNGRWLAVGRQDQKIVVWDLESKTKIATLEGQTNSAFSLSFSPDDRTLASSNFATVKLWHVDTWQELMSVQADAKPVQFSPDGRYLAALVFRSESDVFPGEGAGLRVWKTPTLQQIDAKLTIDPRPTAGP